LNQRLDNADLVNNGDVLVRPGDGNRSAREAAFKPRALIPRENPNAWQFIETNTNIIDSALKSDESLKGDARHPRRERVPLWRERDRPDRPAHRDGISIIQSMAQKRLVAMVNQLAHAYKRKGRQEIALDPAVHDAGPGSVRIDSKDGFEWQLVHAGRYPRRVRLRDRGRAREPEQAAAARKRRRTSCRLAF
jgi:hypothetical protein